MEKQERVAGQVVERNLDDIPGAREPSVRVPHATFRLKPARPEPLVRQAEALATVIVFLVVNPDRPSVAEHGTGRRHPVRNAREQLRQVERRVGVMANPEQEHLSVQIVHPPDGAFGNMRRQRERIGGDSGGFRSGGREGMSVMDFALRRPIARMCRPPRRGPGSPAWSTGRRVRRRRPTRTASPGSRPGLERRGSPRSGRAGHPRPVG